MPWVTKDGVRKFELRLPIPTITHPKPPYPDLAFAESYPREHRARWLWWRRTVVEFYELYRACPRDACRRNNACCGADAECYDAVEGLLKERVYPEFKKALREMPPPPDETPEDEPAKPPAPVSLPLSPRKRGSRGRASRAHIEDNPSANPGPPHTRGKRSIGQA